ncbi:hypothetical protein Leryth_009648 [Lithospermum erythrorhizon]|nr:hypothetical protein Leryth_009648 [Lithospermum erythrorhizon]
MAFQGMHILMVMMMMIWFSSKAETNVNQEKLSSKVCENLGFTGLALCSDCNTLAEYVKDQELVLDCLKCCTEDSDDSMSKVIYSGAILRVCMRKLVFYPELVGFIEDEDKFPSLEVQYAFGSPPTLIMLDDEGQPKETIRLRVLVGGLLWSFKTPQSYVAVFVPESKGMPASVQIFACGKDLQSQPIARRSFFRCSTVQMSWNNGSTGLLIVVQADVDKTNQRPVHDVQWSSTGKEFAVLCPQWQQYLIRSASLYLSLGAAFWDYMEKKQLGTTKAECSVTSEWSPMADWKPESPEMFGDIEELVKSVDSLKIKSLNHGPNSSNQGQKLLLVMLRHRNLLLIVLLRLRQLLQFRLSYLSSLILGNEQERIEKQETENNGRAVTAEELLIWRLRIATLL